MTSFETGRARSAKGLFALLLAACALVPLARHGSHARQAPPASPEWPTAWEGRGVRPLALSAIELRFASRFPGHIARLTDGSQVIVLRTVTEPTRLLHPATDCYRGLGYHIRNAQLETDGQARLWRCFIAERDGRSTRVCERIVDAQGGAYTDTSSWYWAAQFGRSTGPWQAVTVARAL